MLLAMVLRPFVCRSMQEWEPGKNVHRLLEATHHARPEGEQAFIIVAV
jgi:hypothetical protein